MLDRVNEHENRLLTHLLQLTELQPPGSTVVKWYAVHTHELTRHIQQAHLNTINGHHRHYKTFQGCSLHVGQITCMIGFVTTVKQIAE